MCFFSRMCLRESCNTNGVLIEWYGACVAWSTLKDYAHSTALVNKILFNASENKKSCSISSCPIKRPEEKGKKKKNPLQ